jgi:multiple antibiotic resistance protein
MGELVDGWQAYSRFLIGLIAILDPFIAVPIFLAAMAGRSEQERVRTVKVVTFTVFLVLISASLVGELLLTFMGGTLASFRVGGGLVLLLMALAMLNARTGDVRQTAAEAQEIEHGGGAGVVPLAVPLLAGPGSISTVIVASHGGGWLHHVIIAVCIALACAALWLSLKLAGPVGARLGVTGLNIATRLLGLLLAAFANENMATGLKALFPGLG